jgi:Na+/phosphate symporter
MSFENGILHLANWAGNVILPTIAALFIATAILQFSRNQEYSHAVYGALGCLLVSGLTRAMETFASQRAWNDPDQYWIAVLTFVNWTCNVLLPVYAALQITVGVWHFASDHHFHPSAKWMRHLATAGLCLMVSGLLRLAEFFIAHGTGGIS